MGEEPLAATRVAIGARRAAMERDADALRDALNLKKRFAENPPLFVGIGAAAVFLLAGGPVRVAKLLRRRLLRTQPEKAYDALPKPLQSWVDQMAGTVGPRAEEAREALAAELARWRHNPRRHGKVSKKLAEEMAKGPAGPRRTAWSAFEAGAAILTAALARKAVERFLSGEPPSSNPALDAVGTATGAAQPDADKAKKDVTRSPQERSAAAAEDAAKDGGGGRREVGGYSGLSELQRQRSGERQPG